jgi:hypothetical protein
MVLSDISSEGAFSPLVNILQGHGPLPQMFRGADLDVPCSEEQGVDCNVVKASYPATPEHTSNYKPRPYILRPKFKFSMRDKYASCLQDSAMYDPACESMSKTYGRRVRRGVWPHDSTIVEWRLHKRVSVCGKVLSVIRMQHSQFSDYQSLNYRAPLSKLRMDAQLSFMLQSVTHTSLPC